MKKIRKDPEFIEKEIIAAADVSHTEVRFKEDLE